MIYNQTDLKTIIRAAQATKSKVAEFYAKIHKGDDFPMKKFEAVVNTSLDTKADICPFIRVRYEQDEFFKIVFYSFQQLKMLAEDLTNFTSNDEYFEIIRKKY